jgi:trehalose 6-phosphate synthase
LAKGFIPTSPVDVEETAEALYEALTLPTDERKIKAATARQAVERHDLRTWIAKQIHEINDLLDHTLVHVQTSTPQPTSEEARVGRV